MLTGLLGGYASGSMVLVAAQTPKARSGWALGVMSAGIMAGNLVGPLIGGVLPPLIGIRATFFLAGAVIFVTFLGTTFFIREVPRPAQARTRKPGGGWSLIPDKLPMPLKVHRHEGEPCPRCGETLKAVHFEDYIIAYCPKDQTEGRVLKDRRMSRLLK